MINVGMGEFVKTREYGIGVVVGTEYSGGVYRGHCKVWFGSLVNNGKQPHVLHLLILENWEIIPTPIGA